MIERLHRGLDSLVLFKRGHAIWLPVLPIATATAVLYVTSLTNNNPLILLYTQLSEGDPLALVAGTWLSVVLTALYVNNVYSMVARAYLLSKYRWRRVLISAVLFLGIATLLEFGVLRQIPDFKWGPGGVWVSYLMALIALLGLGWRLPDYSARLLRLPYPDYTEARVEFEQFVILAGRIERPGRVSWRVIEECLSHLSNLREGLATYRAIETPWGIQEMENIIGDIDTFANLFKQHFLCGTDDYQNVNTTHVAETFRGHYKSTFPGVKEQLQVLINHQSSIAA